MDDLISRYGLLEAMPKDDILMSLDVRRCICDAPAVDAVKVVRCKDCVNMGKHPLLVKGYREDCGCCMAHGWIVSPETFCSWGKTADEKYCPNCGARMDGGADHEAD